MDLVKVLIILLLLLIAGCIMYIDHSGDGEIVIEFFDGNDLPLTFEPVKKGAL